MKGRVGAPLFSREFLGILEDLVLDPFLPHPQRIAAGKLRLCIQSSTRYGRHSQHPSVTLRVGQTPWRVGYRGFEVTIHQGKVGGSLVDCLCNGGDGVGGQMAFYLSGVAADDARRKVENR